MNCKRCLSHLQDYILDVRFLQIGQLELPTSQKESSNTNHWFTTTNYIDAILSGELINRAPSITSTDAQGFLIRANGEGIQVL